VQHDKLIGLQTARAVAALSIAYFHSWMALLAFPKDTAYPIAILANHGWIAVDFFFAISGFVICLVVAKTGVSPVSFMIKRAFRLYPLWLFTLIAWGAVCYVWRGFSPIQTDKLFLLFGHPAAHPRMAVL
jgi:exopolysaccharide production protein ExoZ